MKNLSDTTLADFFQLSEVFDIMRSEFKDVDGFKSWHQERVMDSFIEKKGTVGYFAKRRIETVHHKIINPKLNAKASLI